MPAFPRADRRIATPISPSKAQIIQLGKYDPKMFLEGEALHAVNAATDVIIAAARNRLVACMSESQSFEEQHEFMTRYFPGVDIAGTKAIDDSPTLEEVGALR